MCSCTLQFMLSESSIQKLAKNIVPILEQNNQNINICYSRKKPSYVAIIAQHLPNHSIYVFTLLLKEQLTAFSHLPILMQVNMYF